MQNNEGTENQQTTPSPESLIDGENQMENFEPEMTQVYFKHYEIIDWLWTKFDNLVGGICVSLKALRSDWIESMKENT